MASEDDVKKLAALARIAVGGAELPRLSKEFESIVAYVGKLDELDVSARKGVAPPVRNVFREDGEPHEAGKHTEALAAQFPGREGDSLKVKQIISHD